MFFVYSGFNKTKEYKMLQVNRADHLNLSVKDLDKTINFYDKVFGFKVREEGVRNGRRYAIIGQEGVFYLAVYESDHVSEIGHIGLNLVDFDSAKAKLKEAGVKIDHEAQYPESRSIYIYDPNGFEIELSQHFGGLAS